MGLEGLDAWWRAHGRAQGSLLCPPLLPEAAQTLWDCSGVEGMRVGPWSIFVWLSFSGAVTFMFGWASIEVWGPGESVQLGAGYRSVAEKLRSPEPLNERFGACGAGW